MKKWTAPLDSPGWLHNKIHQKIKMANFGLRRFFQATDDIEETSKNLNLDSLADSWWSQYILKQNQQTINWISNCKKARKIQHLKSVPRHRQVNHHFHDKSWNSSISFQAGAHKNSAKIWFHCCTLMETDEGCATPKCDASVLQAYFSPQSYSLGGHFSLVNLSSTETAEDLWRVSHQKHFRSQTMLVVMM